MEDITSFACMHSNCIHTALSTIIGGIIGFFSAWHISRTAAINLARSKFRASIAPEILRLKRDHPDKSFGDSIKMNHSLRTELKNKVEIYSQAVEEYRPYVPFRLAKKFEQKVETLFQSISMGLGDISHLEALLECAKP